MAIAISDSLAALYREDETAWLDAMAEAVRRRDFEGLDFEHLEEYLSDMAERDRREVKSRLVILLAQLLKWEFQPEKRSRSWRTTVLNQRQEPAEPAGRGALRRHAEAILAAACANAVELAASETGRPGGSFPPECPYTFAELLAIELRVGDDAGSDARPAWLPCRAPWSRFDDLVLLARRDPRPGEATAVYHPIERSSNFPHRYSERGGGEHGWARVMNGRDNVDTSRVPGLRPGRQSARRHGRKKRKVRWLRRHVHDSRSDR